MEAANERIRILANDSDLPYVDYYKLILHHQPVNWHGTLISADGTHPSAGGGGNDFSQDGLTTTDGYAARTKLALDLGEKLQAIVFEDGEPEPMFADGFESGHTVGWSSVAPLPLAVSGLLWGGLGIHIRPRTNTAFKLHLNSLDR